MLPYILDIASLILFVFCYLNIIQIRASLSSLESRINKITKNNNELDNEQISSYNSMRVPYDPKREEFINNMTKLKLVYDSDMGEWEKLKELEE
jgi:cell division protein FtsL